MLQEYGFLAFCENPYLRPALRKDFSKKPHCLYSLALEPSPEQFLKHMFQKLVKIAKMAKKLDK